MTDTTTNQPERGTTAEEAQQPPQGTLEHLDPHALALGLSARKLLSREILAGQCVENAFATRRRC